MDSSKEHDGELTPAGEAFAEYLARCEDGEALDFARFCEERPEIAADLARLHARWAAVIAPLGAPAPESEHVLALLQELPKADPARAKYEDRGPVARGGMGEIRAVWDRSLRRTLAMKVLLPAQRADGFRGLVRFLEEAQISGQLDHPGIVPVHELGLDAAGRAYFTMPLIRGRNLGEVYALVRQGQEDWTLARALGVLLRVCEAVAYAHSKGVLHRDLKPANVMVGPFGETYVMDWGLAKVLGGADAPRPAGAAVRTARSEAAADTPDSSLLTVAGTVIGTPSYLAPEQAAGSTEIDARADVYSIGAMLYELLSGKKPYAKETPTQPAEILAALVAGPPVPLRAVAPDVPAELEAICTRAMAWDASARYDGVLSLARDLRAFLEGRVVEAYETGALAELRKWIARNRALAWAIGAAALLALAGLGGILWSEHSRRTEVEAKNTELGLAREKEAEQARLARERAAQVLRLSDLRRLDELEERALELWPPHPDNVGALATWLADAGELERRRGTMHEPTLATTREHALAAAGASWTFTTAEEQWEHDTLAGLVARLEQLAAPGGSIADVTARLDFARRVEAESVSGPEARERWAEAIPAIADPTRSPRYAGLVIRPQLGLLPLGPDPETGLWEFAHLQSGSVPRRDEQTGAVVLAPESGFVLVLIPGGSFTMGAQRSDPSGPNHFPLAAENEGPPHAVTLAPFFLSKFEMTQSQWRRARGVNPAEYSESAGGPLHPVETVSWRESAETMRQLGLLLPTEAQWEHAARAGTTTPWPSGAQAMSLEGHANVRDRSFFEEAREQAPEGVPYEEFEDGYAAHAPVGCFEPNAFGLFDVIGNVLEWCRDDFAPYSLAPGQGDGLRTSPLSGQRVSRGGGFWDDSSTSRVTARSVDTPDYAFSSTGLRPARALDQ